MKPTSAGVKKAPIVEKKYLIPFILITSLFALWGFANDITNPMVAAFQTVMELSATKASMVQFAFYGGYATMAIPAALFIRKYSYKSGILLGLALYAVGAFLFIPAAQFQQFSYFCLSLYILTFGLAFLETTANPFILSLGAKESSTRRLNFAQAFNPVGSLSGMAVASLIVLPNLLSDARNEAGEIIFPTLDAAEKAQIRVHDLAVIRDPYVAIGLIVLVMLVVIALTKMPNKEHAGEPISAKSSLANLWKNKTYRLGVLTQMFYVAAQIMVWTFIIQYADNLGINKATAQNYNILAMGLALSFRFIGTYVMKYIPAPKLLAIFGIGAICCTLGAILIVGYATDKPCVHQCLHVHHVPEYLRHSPRQSTRTRHIARLGLPRDGYCGRRAHAPAPGLDHRHGHRDGNAFRQRVVRTAADMLLRGDLLRILRSEKISQSLTHTTRLDTGAGIF